MCPADGSRLLLIDLFSGLSSQAMLMILGPVVALFATS